MKIQLQSLRRSITSNKDFLSPGELTSALSLLELFVFTTKSWIQDRSGLIQSSTEGLSGSLPLTTKGQVSWDKLDKSMTIEEAASVLKDEAGEVSTKALQLFSGLLKKHNSIVMDELFDLSDLGSRKGEGVLKCTGNSFFVSEDAGSSLSSFASLQDTPASIADNAVVRVKADESGVEFVGKEVVNRIGAVDSSTKIYASSIQEGMSSVFIDNLSGQQIFVCERLTSNRVFHLTQKNSPNGVLLATEGASLNGSLSDLVVNGKAMLIYDKYDNNYLVIQ